MSLLEPVLRGATDLVLRDARVLDVRTGALTPPRHVLVRQGRLADLDLGALPGDLPAWPCEGGTLVPGLVDCHAHVLSFFAVDERLPAGPWVLRQIVRNLAATLASGVVCVRDMLAPLRVVRLVRDRLRRHAMVGPDMMIAGPMVSYPGGYPFFIRPLGALAGWAVGQPRLDVASPAQAREAVARLARAGVDHVKVGVAHTTADFASPLPVMPLEVLAALVDAAHQAGLPVAAHHSCGQDLPLLLQAGVDSVEHVQYDPELSQETAAELARRRIWQVPTITTAESMARFDEKREFLESPAGAALLEPQARAHLLALIDDWQAPQDHYPSLGITRGNHGGARRYHRGAQRLVAAGARLAAGTDLGAALVFPGELHDELARLHGAGMSRPEAIRAATLHAAELLGREDLGALEVGRRADLLLADGDPTADLAALRRVRLVGRGGRWFRPTREQVADVWCGRGTWSAETG